MKSQDIVWSGRDHVDTFFGEWRYAQESESTEEQ